MAVIVQYVVEHKGVQKLVTTDKKAADQYDKMLDVADNLAAFIQAKGISLEEQVLEELSIELAKSKDAVAKLLKGSELNKVLEDDKADVVALERKQA